MTAQTLPLGQYDQRNARWLLAFSVVSAIASVLTPLGIFAVLAAVGMAVWLLVKGTTQTRTVVVALVIASVAALVLTLGSIAVATATV